jgi:hypothetical protein
MPKFAGSPNNFMDVFDRIRANAALVVKTFGENNDVHLDYDADSVAWVDGYIERNRQGWDEQTAENLSNVLGSFLGECIRRNYGGEWTMTENGIGVAVDEKNVVFPLHKAKKQIRNGSEDSIASFYQIIPVIFKL